MWKAFLFLTVAHEAAAALPGAGLRDHEDDEAMLLVQQWWRKEGPAAASSDATKILRAHRTRKARRPLPARTRRSPAASELEPEVTEDVPITLLGVYTHGREHIRMHGFPGWNFTNAGAGRKWQGWYGRVVWYRDALQKLVEKDPDQMVIVADVGDMMYGGCSNHDLMLYYQDTVKQSAGSPVIFGATIFLTPMKYLHEYERLQYRAKNVRTAASMPVDAYCSDKVQLRALESIGYSYPNAGFAMGPAERVLEAYQGMLDIEANVTETNNGKYDDQLAAGIYMLSRPDLITLDYTGRIVLTEDPRLIECNNASLHVKLEGNKILNTVTGFPVCFLHGNGGSWRMMADAWKGLWSR